MSEAAFQKVEEIKKQNGIEDEGGVDEPDADLGGGRGGPPIAEPWPNPVNGEQLLDEVVDYLSGVVIMPEGGQEAAALYALLTFVPDALEICPYLAFMSPTKRAGKSVALGLMENIVNKPMKTANATTSSLFRAIDRWHPTMLIDESDTFFADDEGLRGILNAGYDRTQVVTRSEAIGKTFEPRDFNPFGPKIIAGIGGLPGTVTDRTILITMQRKGKDDKLVPYRRRERRAYREKGAMLRSKIARWTMDHFTGIDTQPYGVPDELDDRAADNWEPLIAIADEVGGRWTDLSRQIAVSLSASRKESEDPVEILLRDMFRLFHGEWAEEPYTKFHQTHDVLIPGTQLTTGEILNRLTRDDHFEMSGWKDYEGPNREISTTAIGKLFGAVEIVSKAKRVGTNGTTVVQRVYEPYMFERAWEQFGIGE